MLFDAAVQDVHEVVIEHEQRLAERHRRRPEHRQGDGSDQQHGSQHGQDTLGNHMNSFSFVRPVYNDATNSP